MVSTSIVFEPESLGFEKVKMEELMGGDQKKNAAIFKNILENKATDAQKNMAILNATFAIQASGKVEKLEEAKELAIDSLESGKALKVFNNFVAATNDAMGTFKYWITNIQ